MISSSTALALAFAIGAAQTARAQSYTAQTTSGTFSSIAASGSLVTLTDIDDGYGSFTAPFSFSWFGSTVFSGDTLYVNTNGMLAVGTAQTDRVNGAIPTAGTPDNYVAPFWDDLYFLSGGVYYGTSGNSGSYVLTVEWSNVSHYSAQTDSISFQVKIYQATGVVELWYGSRSGGSTWTGSIGIENSTGSTGTGETCNPTCTLSSVASGTVIRYTPSSSPPTNADLVVAYVDTPPSSVQAGSAYSLFWEVDNYGTAVSSQSAVGVYAGLSPTVTASDFQLDYQIVAAISAGSYTTGYFNATIPSTINGTYYVAAIVDPLNSLSETNESNNTFSLGQVTVTGGGGTIYVTTEGLPNATVNQFYSAQLTQSGGTAPYWEIYSGSLPSNIYLNSSGSISGTALESGTYSFTVQCSESGKTPGQATLSITVNPATGGPTITTTSLPAAAVGVEYHAQVSATGGTPPYNFSFGETHPDWLSIDASTGNLFGIPSTPGTHTVYINVRDNNLASSGTNLQLEVVQPTELLLNTTLPAGGTGEIYLASLVIGGVPPYTIQVTQGSLPPGLTIDNSNATLKGTPTRMGSYTFTVDITDSGTPQGHVSGQMTVMVVVPTGLQIKIGEELAVYTGTDAHVELAAEGGVPPYTWTLVQGSLQSGLVLNPTGFIDGRVMLASTATVTLRVQDTLGASDSAVVFVKAQPYRPAQRGGGGRDRGCGCETSAEDSAGATGALLMLFGVAMLFRRRA